MRLPAPFVRRVGHAVMQHLPVLHVQLRKAHWTVGLETALLAIRYPERHVLNVLAVLQSCAPAAASAVRGRFATSSSAGGEPSSRGIARCLSKAQRAGMSTAKADEIRAVLSGIAPMPDLIDAGMSTSERSKVLHGCRDVETARLRLAERTRNERRLREVLRAYRSGGAASGAYLKRASFPSRTRRAARLDPPRKAGTRIMESAPASLIPLRPAKRRLR